MDYAKLGFKCGLEIHQQIDGKKLFCDCLAINSSKKPNISFERRLRAVAGETGHVDVAAQHEMQKSKLYKYVANSEDTCMVEFDEEPPHSMNKDALQAVLEVCHHLNAKIVDEIRVMRKTVVDGSNVSGFQRTALVGFDGHIDTTKGKVGVTSICIEEEAAQKYNADKGSTTYKLDRLGITLIEIATDPDIIDPDHAKETAEKLGMILRSTGKMKRGLGTIRQDVNVSIKGGSRTEIKGFQDLKSIPRIIEHEVIRQQKLIKQSKKIKKEVRKAEPDFSTSFLRPMPGAARMYPETDVPPVKPEKVDVNTELIEDKIKRYEKLGLANDLAVKIANSEPEFFESMVTKNPKIKVAYIAETIISYKKELIRDYRPCDPELVTQNHLTKIFEALNKAEISNNSVMDIIVEIAKRHGLNISKHKIASVDDLEDQIKKIVKANKGAPMGAIMGTVMAHFKGKIDGKTASELVKKYT